MFHQVLPFLSTQVTPSSVDDLRRSFLSHSHRLRECNEEMRQTFFTRYWRSISDVFAVNVLYRGMLAPLDAPLLQTVYSNLLEREIRRAREGNFVIDRSHALISLRADGLEAIVNMVTLGDLLTPLQVFELANLFAIENIPSLAFITWWVNGCHGVPPSILASDSEFQERLNFAADEYARLSSPEVDFAIGVSPLHLHPMRFELQSDDLEEQFEMSFTDIEEDSSAAVPPTPPALVPKPSIPPQSYARYVVDRQTVCRCAYQVSKEATASHFRWFVAANRVREGRCSCDSSIGVCDICFTVDALCDRCHAVKYGIDEERLRQVDFISPAEEARPATVNPNHTRAAHRQARRMQTVYEEEVLVDRHAFSAATDDYALTKRRNEVHRLSQAEHDRVGYAQRLSHKVRKPRKSKRKDSEFLTSFGKISLQNPSPMLVLSGLERLIATVVLFRGIPAASRRWYHWIALLDLSIGMAAQSAVGLLSLTQVEQWIAEDLGAADDARVVINPNDSITRVFGNVYYGSAVDADGARLPDVGTLAAQRSLRAHAAADGKRYMAVPANANAEEMERLQRMWRTIVAERAPFEVIDDDLDSVGEPQGAMDALVGLLGGDFSKSRAGQRASLLFSASPFIPFVMMVGGDKDKFVAWFGKRIANPASIFQSTSLFLNIFTDVVTGVIPWMITGDTIYLYPERSWQVWITSVNAILLDVDGDSVKQMTHSRESFDTAVAYLDELSARGIVLQQHVLRDKNTTALREIMNLNTRLASARRKIEADYVRSNHRVEPLVYFLHSEPGQGKTPLMRMLIAASCEWAGWRDNDIFYTLHANFGYEGYNKQTVIVMDELGAVDPNVIPPILEVSLLDTVGTAPVDTNQAFAKGERPMRAEMIMLASNDENAGMWKIFNAPKAAGRRMRYRIVPKVKAAFKSPSTGALRDGIDLNIMFREVWTFDVFEVDNTTASSFFSWKHLVWSPTADYIDRAGAANLVCRDLSYDVFITWFEENFRMRREHALRVHSHNLDPLSRKWCNEHHCLIAACRSVDRACVPSRADSQYEIPQVAPLADWRAVYRGVFGVAQGGCASRIENVVANGISRPPVRDAIINVVNSTLTATAEQFTVKLTSGEFYGQLFSGLLKQLKVKLSGLPWLYALYALLATAGGYAAYRAMVRVVSSAEGATEDLAAQVPESRPEIPRKDFFWSPAVSALSRRPAQVSELSKFALLLENNTRVFKNTLTGSLFNAIGLKGTLFVTNAHHFGAPMLEHDLHITIGDHASVISREFVYRPDGKDLVFFSAPVPPVGDILKYVPTKLKSENFPLDVEGHLNSVKGGKRVIQGVASRLGNLSFPLGALSFTSRVVLVTASDETFSGDCGSPYAQVTTGKSPVLIGIHVGRVSLPEGVRACFVPFNRDECDDAWVKCFSTHSIEGELGYVGELGPLHSKSVFKWAPDLHPMIIGSDISGSVSKLKSHLVRTDFSDELVGPLIKQAPDFRTRLVDGRYVNAQIEKVRAYVENYSGANQVLFDIAAREYFRSIEHLPFDQLSPLTTKECILGVPGQLYARRMPSNTAAGWPKGKKGDYMTEDGCLLSPVSDEIVRVFDSWNSGSRTGVPFFMNSKDEPISQVKQDAGLVRQFLTPPLHYLIICKMVFAPVFALLRADLEGEAAIGINVFGPDWQRIFDDIRTPRLDGSFFTDADFGKWDLIDWFPLLLRQLIVFLTRVAPNYMAKKIWYGSRSISVGDVMRGVLSEESWKHVVVALVHFILTSFMGSGIFGTAEFNCLLLAVVLRMLFILTATSETLSSIPSSTDLRAWESEATASGMPDWFVRWVVDKIYGDDNFQRVDSAVSHFYNPSRMLAASKLIGLRMTDSRKRPELSWKSWDDILFLKRTPLFENGRLLASLEMDSIRNMLQWRDSSSPLTRKQMHAVLLTTARREMFYHGKSVFDEWDARFSAEASRLGISDLCERWWFTWEELAASFDANKPAPARDSAFSPPPVDGEDLNGLEIGGSAGLHCFVLPGEAQGSEPENSWQSPATCGPEGSEAAKHMPILVVWELPRYDPFPFDSQPITNDSSMQVANALEATNNMPSAEGASGFELLHADEATDLSEFLRRPVQIWTGTLSSNVYFYPYEEFLTHPTVAAKIANYRYVSGSIVVRVTLSCSRTTYGLARIACWPGYTPQDTKLADYNIYKLSALPGSWISIPQQQATIFKIPYMAPTPAIDLLLAENLTYMECCLRVYEATNSFTGASEACSARIDVWMEDVVLTQTIPYIGDPQGDDSDEYKQGVISRPATALAKAASSLVPFFGPLAKATEIGAKAIGAIAALFGFSRPMNLVDVGRDTLTTSFGSSKFTGSKFALDPKQELSLGTGLFGESHLDPLSVEAIAGHLILYDIRIWTVTDGIDMILAGWPVTPGLCISDLSSPTSPQTIMQTPMSEVASCFQYWRGTIRYVVRAVVHPSYHAGSLRLFWSSERIVPGVAHDVSNLVVSAILDLSKGNEVVLDIPFQSTDGMLRTSVEFGGMLTSSDQYYNGYVYAQVMTPLRTNQTSGTVAPIRFYVSVCSPKLELCHYWTALSSQLHNVPINSASAVPFVRSLDSNFPAPTTTLSTNWRVKGSFEGEILGKEIMSDDMAIPLFMGERVLSLRVPMKDPQLIYMINAVSPAATLRLAAHMLPWSESSFVVSGVTYAPGTQWNLYNYLKDSFAGWRGGARWYVDTLGQGNLQPLATNRFVFSEALVDDYLYVKTDGAPVNSANPLSIQQNPKISSPYECAVEIPSRSRFLFWPTTNDIGRTLRYNSQGFMVSTGQLSANPIALWWSAAEDFNPVLYLGPRLKYGYSNRGMVIPNVGANRPV